MRETCRVIIGHDDQGLLVRTVFPDDTFVDARCTPVSDYQTTLHHDLLHTLMAVQEGRAHSPVLWDVAHGLPALDKAEAASEETRVMSAYAALVAS